MVYINLIGPGLTYETNLTCRSETFWIGLTEAGPSLNAGSSTPQAGIPDNKKEKENKEYHYPSPSAS